MRGCALLAAVAICGCGRLGFDPRADGSIASDDAPTSGSDASGPNDAMLIDSMPIDAIPAACIQAIDVVTNTAHRSSTCLGFDRIDGCSGAAVEESVYRWVVPANGTYTIMATEFPSGIIRSTGRVNGPCTATTTCPGISQTQYTAGQVIYFALEAPSGCTTYDFLIMSM